MTLQSLISAVERGEFHPEGRVPRFTAMYDALAGMGQHIMARRMAEAMCEGPAATAAILRALEGDA
jgi:hypothetical protein